MERYCFIDIYIHIQTTHIYHMHTHPTSGPSRGLLSLLNWVGHAFLAEGSNFMVLNWYWWSLSKWGTQQSLTLITIKMWPSQSYRPLRGKQYRWLRIDLGPNGPRPSQSSLMELPVKHVKTITNNRAVCFSVFIFVVKCSLTSQLQRRVIPPRMTRSIKCPHRSHSEEL